MLNSISRRVRILNIFLLLFFVCTFGAKPVEAQTSSIEANFSVSIPDSNYPTQLQFTDESVGEITEWNWDLGDNSSSTEQNPIHVYDGVGTYQVALTISGPSGSDTAVQEVTITETLVADFDMEVLGDVAPVTVQFTDQSQGAASWEWSFGDGNSSPEQNPTHIYEADGSYTVTLTISDGIETTTATGTLIIGDPDQILVPRFIAEPMTGMAPLEVVFNDTSVGPIVSWNWTFGDNSAPSTEQHPVHVYQDPGEYTITLTIGDGSQTASVTGLIIVTEEAIIPEASFEATPQQGAAPLEVFFSNHSTGTITEYLWDLGDNTSSTEESPFHTYTEPGAYQVTLFATGPAGTSSTTQQVVVLGPVNNLDPAFEMSPQNEGLPQTYQFTDASQGDIDSWLWTFGEGSLSTEQHPTFTYAEAGTYVVTLSITGVDGSVAVISDVINIVTSDAPEANFWLSTTSGTAPLKINVGDRSTGEVTNYHWNWGDGTEDFTEKASHTYTEPGTYTITLTVTGPGGTNSRTKTVEVKAPSFKACLYVSPGVALAPATIEFNDCSQHGPAVSWFWDFGDTTSSTEQNPYHEYTEPGEYTIILTVVNEEGDIQSAERKVIILGDGGVYSRFSTDPSRGVVPLDIEFEDKSVGTVVSRVWDFGDGATSVEANPVHSYATPGTYVVSLTVTGAAGIPHTQYKTIQVYAPLVPVIQATPLEGIAPLKVDFLGVSDSPVNTWAWEFGDGSTAKGRNVTHVFGQAGEYLVTATAKGPAGTVTTTTTVKVFNPSAISAAFSPSQPGGLAPLEVCFANRSQGDISNYRWGFGDGYFSSATNPCHTYSDPGIYLVSLRIMGPGGAQWATQPVYIYPGGSETTQFSFSSDAGSLNVCFVNYVPNAESVFWLFGDGTSSEEETPCHTFPAPGSYIVLLSVQEGAITKVTTQTVTVPLSMLGGSSGDDSTSGNPDGSSNGDNDNLGGDNTDQPSQEGQPSEEQDSGSGSIVWTLPGVPDDIKYERGTEDRNGWDGLTPDSSDGNDVSDTDDFKRNCLVQGLCQVLGDFMDTGTDCPLALGQWMADNNLLNMQGSALEWGQIAAEEFGLDAETHYDMSWDDLLAAYNEGQGIILRLNTNPGDVQHAVVVEEVTDKKIVYYDPDADAHIVAPRDLFEMLWYNQNDTGMALTISKTASTPLALPPLLLLPLSAIGLAALMALQSSSIKGQVAGQISGRDDSRGILAVYALDAWGSGGISTLWDLAAHYYGDPNDYKIIADHNGIDWAAGDHYNLQAGQIIEIPIIGWTPPSDPDPELPPGIMAIDYLQAYGPDSRWTLSHMAQYWYGNGNLWKPIAEANGIDWVNGEHKRLAVGTELLIPYIEGIPSRHNTWNGNPQPPTTPYTPPSTPNPAIGEANKTIRLLEQQRAEAERQTNNIQNAINATQSTINWLKDQLRTIGDKIAQATQNVARWTSEKYAAYQEWLEQQRKAAQQGKVVQALRDAWEWAKQKAGKLWNLVKKSSQWLWDKIVGEEGLLNDIKSKAQQAWDTMQGLGQKIANNTVDFLKQQESNLEAQLASSTVWLNQQWQNLQGWIEREKEVDDAIDVENEKLRLMSQLTKDFPEGSLIELDGKAYVIQGNQRHHIPDPYTLEASYNPADVKALDAKYQDIIDEVYPEGTPIPSTYPHLSVTHYSQKDSKWEGDKLGYSNELTIGDAGCFMTSTAMVLDYYEVKIGDEIITPKNFNTWLIKNGGYSPGTGLLMDGIGRQVPNSGLSYTKEAYNEAKLRSYLEQGKPVILGIGDAGGTNHYIVVTGYEVNADGTFKYFVNDPGFAEPMTLAESIDKQAEYRGKSQWAKGLYIYEKA